MSSTADQGGRRPLRGREAALARNMEASLSVPTASTIRTFEVSQLTQWRTGLKGQGRSVPVAAVIACAVARTAAEEVPALYRRVEVDGASRILVEDPAVNLGVAVDVESALGHSVVVPVLRDAGSLPFGELVSRLETMAAMCRAGTISVADLRGANLVLTSTGRFGSSTGVPKLPLGPGAIIAAGSIAVPAGLERLALTQRVDPVLTLSSTYDHRVIQGADSGEFLGAVQRRLQSPEFLAGLAAELGSEPAEASRGVRVAAFDPARTADVALLEPVRAAPAGAELPQGVEIEFAHLADPARRKWFEAKLLELRQLPEVTRRRQALNLASDIDVFETFLQRQFLGQKTLSVEGLEATVVALAEVAGRSAADGSRHLAVGMAHRGRLSIMAFVLSWPPERILSEFLPDAAPFGAAFTGDVRQHLGGSGVFSDIDGTAISVSLEENPSHLEFVSPVALGGARARQDRLVASGLSRVQAQHDVLPVLLHGDAAFTGQGVVYETFNLQGLDAYHVGGTIHIVQDNRLGFTATPSQLRSTSWPSDVVRGFEVPVLHTDADDLDANLVSAQIAADYRQAFGSDVVMHVQGYRRWGHNESDEPRYTQPGYYADVDVRRPVFELYDELLAAAGVVEAGSISAARLATRDRLVRGLETARHGASQVPAGVVGAGDEPSVPAPHFWREPTSDWCLDVLERAEQDRDDFAVHPKLRQQFAKRREQRSLEPLVDWGQGELLALTLINQAGVPIRMTGEDVERGTFSHRHLVLHDHLSGIKAHRLSFDGAPFLIANTPLSEVSTVGFEYGYGRTHTGSLQLWEAQFGDFVNVAQVMFDQFVMAGRDKWGRDGRLVVLLPHGWEGAGPEHSSGRLERFLQLCARSNARVLVPTTAAQYFAALVIAAQDEVPLPHVIFTPKSLLRADAAKSPASDFAPVEYQPILASGCALTEARRLVLCSGKVAVDAESSLEGDVRLVRLERLYPFPVEALRREIDGAPRLEEVVWLQEEPENMGAWRHVSHQLLRAGLTGPRLGYVGRPEAASPAEGYAQRHREEQSRLLGLVARLGASDFWLTGSIR
jgi:2-oxoglutarate decarboxylase